MASTLPTRRRDARQRLATTVAWRPEWPFALVAVAAWAALLAAHRSLTEITVPGVADGAYLCALGGAGVAAPTLASPAGVLAGWGLMSTAMMVPTTLPATRFVALNSIRRRRGHAMAVFVSAYLAVWVAFGAVLFVVIALIGVPEGSGVIATTLVIAAGWQLTPWKRRAVLACPRPIPLPPCGVRADMACARFGIRHASRCVASAWALMLLMMVVGHQNVPLMILLTGVMMTETHVSIGKAAMAPIAATLVVAAAVVLLLDWS